MHTSDDDYYDDYPINEIDDFEEDEVDVDVCVCCGKYYGLTQTIIDLWNNRKYPETSGMVMPQFCHRCMRDHYCR